MGDELRMSLLEHLEELRDRLCSKAGAGADGGARFIGAIFAGRHFQNICSRPYGRPAQVLDPTGSVTNYFPRCADGRCGSSLSR